MEKTTNSQITSNFLHKLSARLSFAAFGISAFINLDDPYNKINIIYGILVGLLFGFLCKLFLKFFLKATNGDVSREYGKKAIKHAVNRGMAYIFPFGVMNLISTYLLGGPWLIVLLLLE